MEPGAVRGSAVRLSDHPLWDRQRRYYRERGIDAWRPGALPFFATSQTAVARALSEVIGAFLDETGAGREGRSPALVVEVGAGTGTLGFRLLGRLADRDTDEPASAAQAPSFHYVMTDLAEATVEFWEGHPDLAPRIAEGRLETAVYDVEEADALVLRPSGRALGAGDWDGPMILLASYVFDALRHDLFRVARGGEAVCELEVARASADGTADLAALSANHDPAKASPSADCEEIFPGLHFAPVELPFYGEPALDEALAALRDALPDRTQAVFPLPVGGLRALAGLRRIATGPVLVLLCDKCLDLRHFELGSGWVPSAALHDGSFSMSVNLHALAADAEIHGGEARLPRRRQPTLSAAALLYGSRFGAFPRTREAVREHLEDCAPGDLLDAYVHLARSTHLATADTLLADLHRLAWDDHVFLLVLPHLLRHLPAVSPAWRRELVENLPRVADSYYFLPYGDDTFFHLGALYQHLGEFDQALACLERSVGYFGPSGDRLFNQALCHHFLGDDGRALEILDEAVDLAPDDVELRGWRRRLREGGERPAAPLSLPALSPVRSKGGLLEDASEPEIFDTDRRLSESRLWTLQREFFDREGEKAWTDQVPFYVTSNPYIADACAQVACRYLQDQLRLEGKGGGSESADGEPFYVLELGAGPGKFTFHFVERLTELLGALGLGEVPVVHVMTDFAEKNLEHARRHPALAPHVEAGRLDFAVLDLEDPAPLQCRVSGRVIGEEPLARPPVVLANYVFDTVPHDLFRFRQGRIEEGRVTLSRGAAAGRRQGVEGEGNPLAEVAVSYDYRPVELPYYGEPEIDGLLADYRDDFAEADDFRLLIPVAALRCLSWLRRLSGDRLLLLATDKGFARGLEHYAQDDPSIAFHASVSMMVNFDALGRACCRAGGSWQPPAVEQNIVTAAFLLGDAPETLVETRTALATHLERFSPANLFSLYTHLAWTSGACRPETLLAALEATGWDPAVFELGLETLLAVAAGPPSPHLSALLASAERVAANAFHLEGGPDTFFHLGLFYQEAGWIEAAREAYEESLRRVGERAEAYYNLGQCHARSGEAAAARRCFRRAAELSREAPSPSGEAKVEISALGWLDWLEERGAEPEELRAALTGAVAG